MNWSSCFANCVSNFEYDFYEFLRGCVNQVLVQQPTLICVFRLDLFMNSYVGVFAKPGNCGDSGYLSVEKVQRNNIYQSTLTPPLGGMPGTVVWNWYCVEAYTLLRIQLALSVTPRVLYAEFLTVIGGLHEHRDVSHTLSLEFQHLFMLFFLPILTFVSWIYIHFTSFMCLDTNWYYETLCYSQLLFISNLHQFMIIPIC